MTTRVLVIGGNRFIGREVALRLRLRGHRVAVLNRGTLPHSLPPDVEHIVANRADDSFDAALRGREFDSVVDFAGFEAPAVERAVRVLHGRVGHYVFISTGQVYLVRENCPMPARESDYAGATMEAPPPGRDLDQWAYGMGKRHAEDVLERAAHDGFPATRLRIPIVQGPRDPERRLERLVFRMLDGGPVLLTRPDAPARHVYVSAVAATVVAMLGRSTTFGRAYNLAMPEIPTVRELVERVGAALGIAPRLAHVTEDALAAFGLTSNDLPMGTRWVSLMDPSLAVAELGFAHPPLDAWLPASVTALLAYGLGEPTEDLVTRPRELALAASLA